MLDRFKRGDAVDPIMAALARDGGAIVEGFLPADLIATLRDDFSPHLDAASWSNTDSGEPNEFFGLQTKRLHGLLSRSATFGEVITDPLLLAMCDHFLKPHTRHYRVSTGELMALGRGQDDQYLHRDADSWAYFPQPRPEILVSANVALTDFTEHNGATRVAVGSHLWPADRKPDDAEIAQAVMPAGSALLYVGNVLHGGGANATDELRIGMYVGYILSWLRPIENHAVTNTEAALRAASPEAQRLLNYNESGFDLFA